MEIGRLPQRREAEIVSNHVEVFFFVFLPPPPPSLFVHLPALKPHCAFRGSKEARAFKISSVPRPMES